MAGIYIQSGVHPDIIGHENLAYFGLDKHSDGWKRLDEHYKNLKKGRHPNVLIQDFYNDFGIDQIYRGIVIECDEYYLNTLEKAYIYFGNTNNKYNPYGWNRSGGGEGATKYKIPYSFVKDDTLHRGTDLLPFLKMNNQIDPSGFIGLLDGRIDEYNGFKIY